MNDCQMTVIVTSCNAFVDVLEPFSVCFKKYWGNCSFPVVLTTESEPQKQFSLFKKVYTFENKPWTERLLLTLKDLNTPYVMNILDDYFVSGNFSDGEADHYIKILEKENAGVIRLSGGKNAHQKITHEYGEFARGEIYRITAQISIWKREYLIAILEALEPSEAWNFERKGSGISEQFPEKSLGLYAYNFPHVEMIRRSCWLKSGVDWCKKEGVTLDMSTRPVQPISDVIFRALQGFVFSLNPKIMTKLAAIIKK